MQQPNVHPALTRGRSGGPPSAHSAVTETTPALSTPCTSELLVAVQYPLRRFIPTLEFGEREGFPSVVNCQTQRRLATQQKRKVEEGGCRLW